MTMSTVKCAIDSIHNLIVADEQMNTLFEPENGLAKICTKKQLPILIDLLCWKPFENILVLGDSITGVTGLLLAKAEKYFSAVTAIDVSSEMVERASKNISHSLVTFLVGNIMDPEDDHKFQRPLKQNVKFDKIFSIHHRLLFVKDYEEFFKRIHHQLNKGGQLAVIIFSSNLQILYHKLREHSKWKRYLMEIQKPRVPLWTFGDPQENFSSYIKYLLISSLDMEIVDFVSSQATHSFDSLNEFTYFVWASTNGINNVPPELHHELRQEMAEQGAEIFGVNSSTKSFTIKYNYVRFIAQK